MAKDSWTDAEEFDQLQEEGADEGATQPEAFNEVLGEEDNAQLQEDLADETGPDALGQMETDPQFAERLQTDDADQDMV